MKTRKILSLMLILSMLLSVLACFSISASAATAWDGKSANVKWYAQDTSVAEFIINTPAELYAMSLICSIKDAPGTAPGRADGKVYYDDNYDIITDVTKITDDTKYVAGYKFDGKTIKLGADIDLGAKPWLPIGSSGSFKGHFDGQNHTVSNITVNQDNAKHKGALTSVNYYYGLFALVAGNGSIKNVNVKNVVLNVDVPAFTTYTWAGGICAYAHDQGCTMTNCTADNVTINLTIEAGTNAKGISAGAIYGVVNCGTNSPQTNITVTNYTLNVGQVNGVKYNAHESLMFGARGGKGTCEFVGCSVQGQIIVEPPIVNDTTTAVDTTPVSDTAKADDTTKSDTTTKAPTTTKADETTKADGTTKAPSTTKAPQNNDGSFNPIVIVIAAAAVVAVVVVVVIVVVLKKKKAE